MLHLYTATCRSMAAPRLPLMVAAVCYRCDVTGSCLAGRGVAGIPLKLRAMIGSRCGRSTAFVGALTRSVGSLPASRIVFLVYLCLGSIISCFFSAIVVYRRHSCTHWSFLKPGLLCPALPCPRVITQQ